MGDTASAGTKFCPAGTQARKDGDHHCMGGSCGDFPESECCVTTCWAAGWREPGEVGSGESGSGGSGSGEVGSGEGGSGGAHGTYQCPAGQMARPWYDMHDCGDRYAAAVGLTPCPSRPASPATACLRAPLPPCFLLAHRAFSPTLLSHPCPTAAGTQVHGAERVLRADVLGGGVARLWRQERQLPVPRDGRGARHLGHSRLRRQVRGAVRVLRAQLRAVRFCGRVHVRCRRDVPGRAARVLVERGAQQRRLHGVGLLPADVLWRRVHRRRRGVVPRGHGVSDRGLVRVPDGRMQRCRVLRRAEQRHVLGRGLPRLERRGGERHGAVPGGADGARRGGRAHLQRRRVLLERLLLRAVLVFGLARPRRRQWQPPVPRLPRRRARLDG